MGNFTEKITSFFKSKDKVKIIVIIGIIGILLILLSEFIPSKKETVQNQSDTKSISIDEYSKALEQKVSEIISQISGVGKVKVLITIESSAQNVYAMEQKDSADLAQDYDSSQLKRNQEQQSNEDKYVLVDGPDGKQALIEKVTQPVVKGVVIVCEGGDNPLVQQRVIEAVTTALDIYSTKVCVTKIVN